MNIEEIKDTPPWEWPKNTRKTLIDVLRDKKRSVAERADAASLAGNSVVVDDELAQLLASIVTSAEEPTDVRAHAAIGLGPVLEESEMEGFEDDGISEPPIEEATFSFVQSALRKTFSDEKVPKEVRRRALEGSVRASQEWHEDAIRTAYASNDDEWKLTAVFCMRFIDGFDKEIVEALENKNPEVHREAVIAAGAQEVDGAWDHVAGLIKRPTEDKDLLLAAMGASALIRPREAGPILVSLSDSEDEEIAEAAMEAMADADTYKRGRFDDEDDEEEEEDE